MALVRIDHVPETIKVNLPLYVLLPGPAEMQALPLASRKVLYLLHGLSDDGSAWQRYTAIEPIAALYGLVVIMPSVGRSFYTDTSGGQLYFTYLTEELPHYLKDVFGLSPSRADTLIAGNSMGGYGAFKAALLRPELYSAAASFSGVLSIPYLAADPSHLPREEFKRLFGDPAKSAGSEHDPLVWLERVSQAHSTLPHLYMSCGRQDELYPVNLQFHAACQAMGVPVDYHEEDGLHDWFFWNTQIQRFLAANLRPL